MSCIDLPTKIINIPSLLLIKMLHSKALLVIKSNKSLMHDTASMGLEHIMPCKNRPESERQISYDASYIKYVDYASS